MNAKLAVAISLGASSLALFGMANVANAATTEPPSNPPSDSNPPAVQQGESATDKAKKKLSKLLKMLKHRKAKLMRT